MEFFYEKVFLMVNFEDIYKGDVRICMWLFEI